MVFIISCRHSANRIPVIAASNTKTDTTLVLKDGCNADVYDVQAVHIVFSDSLDRVLQGQFSTGKLPKKYNFDNFDGDLFFDSIDGSYALSKLYSTNERYQKIKPFALFLSGDTLYTRDSGYHSSNAVRYRGLQFEEVLYKFKSRRRFLRVRDFDVVRFAGGRSKLAPNSGQHGLLRWRGIY
jgi:hypothetical protein